MKEYDAYLFDWDGCLATTLESWVKVYRETYGEYNLHPTDRQIAEKFGDWESGMSMGVPREKFDEFVDKIKTRAHAAVAQAPLYEGAQEALAKLKKKGKKVALLTTSVRETIDAVLTHHDLVQLFDLIVTGSDVANQKPHPECIEFALKELSISKAQAVMVGDSSRDLEAANNAGVDSILFYPPSHESFYDLKSLELLSPTKTISSWSEL